MYFFISFCFFFYPLAMFARFSEYGIRSFFVFSFLFFSSVQSTLENAQIILNLQLKLVFYYNRQKNYYFRSFGWVIVLHLAQWFNDFNSGSAKWEWARNAKGWEQCITAIPLYWMWIIGDVNAYRKKNEEKKTHTKGTAKKWKKNRAHCVHDDVMVTHYYSSSSRIGYRSRESESNYVPIPYTPVPSIRNQWEFRCDSSWSLAISIDPI